MSNRFTLHLGDCLEVLRTIPDNSVDSVVCDPPYGLGKEPDALAMLRDWMEKGHHDHKGKSGFMGKKWDSFVPQPAVWAECLRVLKPGGYLLAFAGTRTQDLVALGLRIAGFEIRDLIAWVYGSGFPKSRNGEWGGTALKPALEPITMARKPLVGTVAVNWAAHGTGALNIDGCRVAFSCDSDKASAKPGGRTTTASSNLAGKTQGGAERADFEATQGAGRWPANLIHDGSDEVVAAFPTQAGASAPVRGTEASAASVGNVTGQRARVPGAFHGDTGSAARFFKQVSLDDEDIEAARFMYCAKASKADRNAGLDEFTARTETAHRRTNLDTADNGYLLAKTERLNTHPTVKPTDLMAYLVRLVTPPGGLVLDPFMGSGSTGKAAMREGMRFIGCELSEEYVAIATARIQYEAYLVDEANRAAAAPLPQLDLFHL